MPERIEIKDKAFRCYLTAEELETAVRQLAREISNDYNDAKAVFVVVLKGAVMFAADLVRNLTIPCELEFIRSRSYGNAMESRGEAALDMAGLSVAGKDVIVVEDIIDTGLTISTITRRLKAYSPNSVRIATLFFKPDSCKEAVEIDYIGFSIPSKFIVGYGLDYAEQGRNLQNVYILENE